VFQRCQWIVSCTYCQCRINSRRKRKLSGKLEEEEERKYRKINLISRKRHKNNGTKNKRATQIQINKINRRKSFK
jgi:hypothetical protein